MVPMIDLMVCCISFLLITAVWSHMARVDSNALVAGDPGLPTAPPDKSLHVDARGEGNFTLTWKQGTTVLRTLEVSKATTDGAPVGGERRYSELAARIAEEWSVAGSHRDPSDRVLDRAVLHTGDKLPFGDIIAIIDAIHRPRRQLGPRDSVSAFNVAFAAD